ncbi:hypothetical protein [Aliivibrio fischeri]|uniref:hypothetical protein n=1 Tax=Aliivibrio fischeri TaxID=668 RepID=UPI0007C5355C|nr:hypothetical protein [Aliivibrio fischeri]
MRTKFDINNAKAWANSGKNANKVIASETTSSRHSTEWDSAYVFSSNDENRLLEINEEFLEFNKKYKTFNDTFKIRASGSKIGCGAINFEDGLNALTGFYKMLKLSANNYVQSKGKTKILKEYFQSLNMLAPQEGSFIYSAEVDLTTNVDEKMMDDVSSINRCINMNFAHMLNKTARFIKNHDEINMAMLIQYDIDAKFCSYFLDLFSESADDLEFYFDWSSSEKCPNELPTYVSFDQSCRDKVQTYKKLLKDSKTKYYQDLPAIIEQYSWKKDVVMGTVSLRLMFETKDHTCSISVEADLYEKLKSLKHKKQVYITGDIIETSGVKNSVEILNLHKISLDENNEIVFNDITK